MSEICLSTIVERVSSHCGFSKIRCFIALSCLLVVTFPSTSLADSPLMVSIDVLEDSYVGSTSRNTNYNSEYELRTARGSTEYLSFLKFDLARIPQGRAIISARLRVFCRLAYYFPPVASHYLDDDTWDEKTITWNNCPKSWNATPSHTQDTRVDHMYYDITDEVILAHNDDGVISIVLRMPDGVYAQAYFYSAQYTHLSHYRPVLEVELSGPKYGGGDGTENNPYLIYTPEQLSWIGDNLNDMSSHFKLKSDIDLSEYTGHQFHPIGNYWKASFDGMFEGNNHVISDFTFGQTSGFNYVGLFGVIGPNSVVRNIGLINPNVDSEGNGTGSLAGLAMGLVENCWATSVNIHGSFRAGGLIGRVYDGLVQNCYVDSGNVSLEYNYAGGFVGENDANIVNCYSACTLTGPGTWLGGFAGNNADGLLTACFYDEDVTGYLPQRGAIDSSTVEMQTMTTFTDQGWDFTGETTNGSDDIWNICPGNGYPFLWWQDSNCPAKYGGGSGTAQEPYQIHTPEQLNRIGASLEDWDKHFILMNDIDLSGFHDTQFNVIGSAQIEPFAGVFNGNGHVISNLTVAAPFSGDYIGLFGVIGTNGVVRDLGLMNPNVDSECNGTGSLAGKVMGLIENCWASSVNIHGGFRVGGLIGKVSDGLVRNCYVDSGNVSLEYSYAGGFVGENDANIVNCYSASAVTGPGNWLGGFVGNNADGLITACFYDEDVTGNLSTWGAIDSSTVEMQTMSTFTGEGWDFVAETLNGSDDIWNICSGDRYPFLSWQDITCPTKYGAGKGTAQEPYQIHTPEQLNRIGGSTDDWDKHFVLMTDIDLSDFHDTQFNAIGDARTQPFVGVFNGNGHVISNLTFLWEGINTNYMGLFGAIGSNSVVRNLGLIKPNVDYVGNGTGALAGKVMGRVENCWASSVNIRGGFRVGGLIGKVAGGFVQNCYVDSGNVSTEYALAGGFVGENDANIVDCYSACSVTGPGTWLGGFVGKNEDGRLTACFYDTDIAGYLFTWGAIRSSTAEMQRMTTFTSQGWDFVGEVAYGDADVWRMCIERIDYPKLQVQYRPGDLECPDGIDALDLARLADEWLMERLSASVDYRTDNIINMHDWALFSRAWRSIPTSGNWDELCDIAPDNANDVIDENDLKVFLANWLKSGNVNVRSDIAPEAKPDNIVNFKDFGKLANEWLRSRVK